MNLWVRSLKKFVEFLIIFNTYLFPFLSLFLLGIPIGITISAIGLKICLMTEGIKKYKSIIKKKKKKVW